MAAGFITIHAIESISLSIPQRPYVNQITQTQDAFKQFSSSIVLPYKNAGYHSMALYGGSMTWRDLEGFFKVQGFDDILGEGNVVVEEKDRHSWGINDNKLFELIEKQLFNEDIKVPKFIYAISTQNHPPYKVPNDYKALPLNQLYCLDNPKDLILQGDYGRKYWDYLSFSFNFKKASFKSSYLFGAIGNTPE